MKEPSYTNSTQTMQPDSGRMLDFSMTMKASRSRLTDEGKGAQRLADEVFAREGALQTRGNETKCHSDTRYFSYLISIVHTMSSPDEENGSTTAATVTATATPITATDASAAGGPPLLCERGIIRSDLGTQPVLIKCGHCNHTGLSVNESKYGPVTFGAAFALIFLFIPLVWLPFCLPSVS
jgi:hypothetical protein